MSIDTKGFVLTNKKDVFKVYEVLRRAIVEKMLEDTNPDDKGGAGWMRINQMDGYSIPYVDLHENGCIWLIFEYRGEHRSLFVAFTRDHDYDDFRKGKKLILSLGCWGHSVHLMETALKALMNEYKCKGYIDENDCDLEDWREIK